MLTAEQWQTLVLLEVGAGLDGKDEVERAKNDVLTPHIQLFWAAWADKAFTHPRLQYLYCKKQCLDILEGQLRDLVQTTIGGFNSNQQQKLANLQAINKRVMEEITIIEKRAQANRVPVMGELTQTSSRMPDPTQVDPNNPVYRGDALVRPLGLDPIGRRGGFVG